VKVPPEGVRLTHLKVLIKESSLAALDLIGVALCLVKTIKFPAASGGVFSADALAQGRAASSGEFNPERLNTIPAAGISRPSLLLYFAIVSSIDLNEKN
jgi:hypothetical protein